MNITKSERGETLTDMALDAKTKQREKEFYISLPYYVAG
jgi:hypothetical protein